MRERRKLKLEARKGKVLEGWEGEIFKKVTEDAKPMDPVIVSADDIAQLERTMMVDARKKLEKEGGLDTVFDTRITASSFRHRRRGDEHYTRALSTNRRPTKIERFQRSVLGDDIEPLTPLKKIYEKARSTVLRPSIRQRPQYVHRPPPKLTMPQTKLEIFGRQVEKLGDRVPLRKITYYIMGKYSKELPPPEKFKLPSWAREALNERGYTVLDAWKWVKVLRASNATEAFEIMGDDPSVWPKFLIQSLLFSSAPRSQGELVKIFGVVQEVWESFDHEGKMKALTKMTDYSAKKLPQGLPRVANLVAITDFEGPKANERMLNLCNQVLSLTADAYQTKQYQNYATLNQLRNYIDDSMITLLGRMAEKNVHVKVQTLRRISAAKLAEDAGAAIEILELAKPKKYVDLVEDMKAQEEDLALAHEVARTERQLSAIEKEFLKGHLLGRVRTKEMKARLNTIQNWRVSTQETFSAWLQFLERRRELGPAPKETWVSILQMCHDEWTFPTAFWLEAFELMEADGVLPDTVLLCLVLKGVKEMEVLDHILEVATTTYLQRMNDRIWTIYLQRLAINHTPRALEIFLNAHNTDCAAGTMDTLNVIYWNTLLNGLLLETRRTNDTVWITRAFDLLDEMERLSIFPSQQTISAVCRIGIWAGDKVQIKGKPAWKASLDKWHEWIVRPEDFSYSKNLNGILRLIPSQKTFRKFIKLTGTYGEYDEMFNATWAMVRFGVQPDWETLLDLEIFMQLSGEIERTTAVRQMFREWLGQYPTPREVIWHHRKWLRTEVRAALETEERAGLIGPGEPALRQIEPPKWRSDMLPDSEVHEETVVEKWMRREREKPWFERG